MNCFRLRTKVVRAFVRLGVLTILYYTLVYRDTSEQEASVGELDSVKPSSNCRSSHYGGIPLTESLAWSTFFYLCIEGSASC